MEAIKDLQTQIDKVKSELKTKSRNWLIALAVAFVLVVILLITVFDKKGDNPKIEALQQQLETEKARVKILEEKLPLYDSLLANQQRQLEGNKQTELIIKHHYDKIPSAVRDLNREQLREQVTNY